MSTWNWTWSLKTYIQSMETTYCNCLTCTQTSTHNLRPLIKLSIMPNLPLPIPHQNPWHDVPTSTLNVKQQKEDSNNRSTPSNPNNHHATKGTQGRRWQTEAIPCIDIVSHMWLGFLINEDIERHRGTPIMKNTCSNIEFHKVGTPSSIIIEFSTLRVPQTLFPNEQLDVVSSHHFHFT